mmetsp:Transcript_55473/g.114930  ORF Transcript_55473/g.114930 Transcript_55473/m.114930 type:complete len:102 (-) Transcript_55473:184-489(-)
MRSSLLVWAMLATVQPRKCDFHGSLPLQYKELPSSYTVNNSLCPMLLRMESKQLATFTNSTYDTSINLDPSVHGSRQTALFLSCTSSSSGTRRLFSRGCVF